jgi:hypothetical protein
MAITLLTCIDSCYYCAVQKRLVISLRFLRNDNAGGSLLVFFSHKCSFQEYCVPGTRILNDCAGKQHFEG